VTALATARLAREDAGVLAMLGSGVQAAAHLRALALVRPLTEVRVFSPNAEHAGALVAAASLELGAGVRCLVAASAREAVEGADVVVTATNSQTPVLERAWLADGVHVNAIGASVPSARELDVESIAAAELFVDSRESAANEAGDYRLARSDGAIGEDHIRAELGEVVIGSHPGRSGPAAITVFRSLGLAVEDLAAAEVAVASAVAAGAGTCVEL
jgi:ornithine cyclodeaminase